MLRALPPRAGSQPQQKGRPMSQYHWTPTPSGHILGRRTVGFAQALTPPLEEPTMPKRKKRGSSANKRELANWAKAHPSSNAARVIKRVGYKPRKKRR